MKAKKFDRLNLGCGVFSVLEAGWVNHDARKFYAHVNDVWDLDKFPWHWRSNAFVEVRAIDVLEHLQDVVKAMNECWRILKRGGVLRVRVPAWDNVNAWGDPTHRRAFTLETFDHFDPETRLGAEHVFYTPHKWRIVDSGRDGADLVFELTPRK